MSFTEVTSQSFFSRIMSSFLGVLFGIVLIIAAFPVLFWNEDPRVKTEQGLAEGAKVVVEAAPDKVDPSHDNKLVHLTAMATTDEELADEDYGVKVKAIKLDRQVQMYQWKQKEDSHEEKQLGGSTKTVTTYTYEKVWANKPISSEEFKVKEGHVNPAQMLPSKEVDAKVVKAGAYTLDEPLESQMDAYEKLPLKADELPEDLKGKAKITDGIAYLGANPTAPAIGDQKVSIRVVKPQTVSLLALEKGETFAPYKTKTDTEIEKLSAGTVSADDMFKEEQAGNALMTWILRGLGWFMMFLGLVLVFKPLSTILDVLPFLGSLASAGTGLFAFLISIVLTLVTIALGWIAYRPIVGIGMLAIAAGAFYMLHRHGSAQKAATAG